MDLGMRELSCGFVIINASNPKQILACQPYGRSSKSRNSHDIPKGHIEEGESTLDAALRELNEETGFVITDETVYDCGMFKYFGEKDLYVYMASVDLDITALHCDSRFERGGEMVPEMVGYEWTEDLGLFYKTLQPILAECMRRHQSLSQG